MHRFLVLLMCWFSIQTASSQEEEEVIDTLKINPLEEVEVRAMYSNIATRRFPAAVYGLSPAAGDMLLPVNMNESLNKIPSVYAHTGTFNTSRITMRGIGTRSLYGTRKINALLNDIPLTSGEGDTFIDDIDLQFIDRMEVIGGPTAGVYGPALGGTMLLYTRSAAESNFVQINSGAGSYGTFQHAASAGISNDSRGVLFMVKNVQSDGYRQNNSYNRLSALLNLSAQGKRSLWNFMALYTNVDAGIPSSIDSAAFASNPRAAAATWAKTKGKEKTERLLAGISHQYRISASSTSNITLYGLYKNSLEIRPFNYLLEDDIAGGLKLNLKHRIASVKGLTLTPGVSVFFERYTPKLNENSGGIGVMGARIAENQEDIFQANAFFIVEYLPNLKNYISLSLNVNKFGLSDRNVFASAEKQNYEQGLSFSPRVSVSRQLVLNHYIFGSISHGLSYPSIQEILYPDGTINSSVKPEKAWSFEAGIKGIRLLGELKYSLAAYYMPVTDLIVPDRIAEDTYIGKNVGKSIHSGVEVLLEKSNPSVSRSIWFYTGDYRITFNWQSNKFRDFIQDNINLKGNNLPGVPGRRMYAMINFRIKRSFFIEPEIYVNGKTPVTDNNELYYPAYNVANVRFGFIHQWSRWNFRISSAVNNVSDKKYASMILINAPSANNRPPRYYYPGLPRNYFFTVSAGFSI